jgi:hypothetical protein
MIPYLGYLMVISRRAELLSYFGMILLRTLTYTSTDKMVLITVCKLLDLL